METVQIMQIRYVLLVRASLVAKIIKTMENHRKLRTRESYKTYIT